MSNRQQRRAAARKAAKELSAQGVDPSDENAVKGLSAHKAKQYRDFVRDLASEATSLVSLHEGMAEAAEYQELADAAQERLRASQASLVESMIDFADAIDPDAEEALIEVPAAVLTPGPGTIN